MSIDTSTAAPTWFSPGNRSAGLSLHITSLPSLYGIGDFGPSAAVWIDRLSDAGQSWWQVLPMGPTGGGNSPYQPVSSFAINWLLVSPARLIEDGLLSASDCDGCSFSSSSVDYEHVTEFKRRLLDIAWSKFTARSRADLVVAFETFRHENAAWLEDYALFRALKTKYGGCHYLEWPSELVQRAPAAVAQSRVEFAADIAKACFAQFLLFRQTERLKRYAHSKGVGLIGDMPFFVSPDSSDVWADPQFFLLDEHRRPRFVAGVPPDCLSAEGQRWGNPVFDWEALRRNQYAWCIRRLRMLLSHVDAIRLNHFRGFAAAWHIPMAEPTARAGHWRPGPGAEFFTSVDRALGGLPFLAEDLGFITADVRALRDQFRLPGTKVLQFAFDGHADNPYLPDNYTANAVAYTATPDNDTSRGWFERMPREQQQLVWKYLRGIPGDSSEIACDLIRVAWSSVAGLAIAPLQDILNLGTEARMNLPGRCDGNWSWRADQAVWSVSTFNALRRLTAVTGRHRISVGLSPKQRR
jgi:4-alpha-glucanotransferase